MFAGLSTKTISPVPFTTLYSTLGTVVIIVWLNSRSRRFLDNFHVEKSEEAASEAEAERSRSFRLVEQRRVIQFEFCKRMAELLEMLALRRVQSAEDHGFYLR